MLRRTLAVGVAGWLAGWLGSTPLPAQAQGTAFGFEFREVAKVVHGPDTLRNAWAGGLDSPQFSNLDLNGDNEPDLVAFDRHTRRVSPFLSVPAPGGGRRWRYAPDYASLFPADLLNWMLLRDYDCDGRPDLFTAGSNSVDIRVFRNAPGPGGRPNFQLAVSRLDFALNGTVTANINTGGANLPAITDVDGDGRLDVLVVDFDRNKYVEYYQNTSTAPCGGLQFRMASNYWGNIQSCSNSCTSYDFTGALCRPAGVLHTSGHNLTLADLNGDGVQDALLGRDYCTELVALLNQGTRAAAAMTSANANFPAGTPVRIPNFPAAYLADVTFDGRPDLLAAPNVFDNLDTIDTRRVVWLYENAGSGAAPNFQFRQPDFLQRDMLETSSLAAPAFVDVDADGRLDMLLAGTRRDTPNGFFVATLAYYRNTGTAARPVYELVTTDYLNLSANKYGVLRPLVADLNRDGAPDLTCVGHFRRGLGGFTAVFLNQAAAGQPVNFNINQPRYLNNLPNSQYDAAAFFDVDNDGNVDLLYGTNSNRTDLPGQSLRYYRNTGTQPLESAFAVADGDFGQIRTAAGTRPQNLCPVVADFDGDARPDLLTVDATGQLRLFADVRAQRGVFVDRTNLMLNPTLNRYDNGPLGTAAQNHSTLAAADVDGDGAPELFIGLESGGVLAAAPRNRVLGTQAAARAALGLALYPNPATTAAAVEAAQPVRLTVLDLTGRIVRAVPAPARRHTLDLRGLAAGLYVVQCETPDGRKAAQKLEVK